MSGEAVIPMVGMIGEIRLDGTQRRCDVCQGPTGPTYYTWLNRAMCGPCFRVEREPELYTTQAALERIEARVMLTPDPKHVALMEGQDTICRVLYDIDTRLDRVQGKVDALHDRLDTLERGLKARGSL